MAKVEDLEENMQYINRSVDDQGRGETQPQNIQGGWPDSLGSDIWIYSEYLGVLEKNKWKDSLELPKNYYYG